MEVLNSELRSMGKSITAMCISLFGSCAMRIIWIQVMTIFYPTIEVVFMAHPASFVVGAIANITVFLYHYRRLLRQNTDTVSALS